MMILEVIDILSSEMLKSRFKRYALAFRRETPQKEVRVLLGQMSEISEPSASNEVLSSCRCRKWIRNHNLRLQTQQFDLS